MIKLIEAWEFYKYGSEVARFVGLVNANGNTDLDFSDGLPKTHGYSYALVRETYKRDFKEKMGFDLLAENPNMPYRVMVKLSHALDQKLGGI